MRRRFAPPASYILRNYGGIVLINKSTLWFRNITLCHFLIIGESVLHIMLTI